MKVSEKDKKRERRQKREESPVLSPPCSCQPGEDAEKQRDKLKVLVVQPAVHLQHSLIAACALGRLARTERRAVHQHPVQRCKIQKKIKKGNNSKHVNLPLLFLMFVSKFSFLFFSFFFFLFVC